jgi:hypothetical protein
MAQTPVPGGWGGSCHKCAGTGRTLRELQGVEGPKTLTSQQGGLGAEILYRNTKRVRFNRNTIVSGKFANREKVLEDVGSNENITKMEWSWDCGVSSANNRESGTITHNDGGRENRGAGGSDQTSMRGDMRGGAGVDHPIRGGWWRVERDSAEGAGEGVRIPRRWSRRGRLVEGAWCWWWRVESWGRDGHQGVVRRRVAGAGGHATGSAGSGTGPHVDGPGPWVEDGGPLLVPGRSSRGTALTAAATTVPTTPIAGGTPIGRRRTRGSSSRGRGRWLAWRGDDKGRGRRR